MSRWRADVFTCVFTKIRCVNARKKQRMKDLRRKAGKKKGFLQGWPGRIDPTAGLLSLHNRLRGADVLAGLMSFKWRRGTVMIG